MSRLGAVIAEAIVHHYGREAFLSRLAHPFWFQSFGAVMGMDWHSSGITTSVLGALKRGLAPLEDELGLYVCGGRGRHARRTPVELTSFSERTGLDGAALVRASRLVAKVDSAAVQDGFDLYLHGFILGADGQWTIVQQGMNGASRTARRYHWHSVGLADFTDAPHAAIEGEARGDILNLTDPRAAPSRQGQLALLADLGPDRVVGEVAKLSPARGAVPAQPVLPHLVMPAHHDIRPSDVESRRLHAALAAAAERGPTDFADLLLVPGVGPRTIQSLALVTEVIHGAPCRFTDPARFAYAHGGKDRHPFPVPVAVYDETLRVLKSAVGKARLGQTEELAALQRLDQAARRLERHIEGPPLADLFARERRDSAAYGGRSVFGREVGTAGRIDDLA